MFKRPYALAIVSFLMIPAISVLAALLINSIDPEIAAGYANYERNYRLLSLAKTLRVGSIAGDYGLVVSDLFFSSQIQATIVWVVALGHVWPVWIEYPEHAQRQSAGARGFVPTIYR